MTSSNGSKESRWGISLIIQVIVVSAILLGAGSIGFFSIRTTYENKLIDSWTILFLELERQGNYMIDRIMLDFPSAVKGAEDITIDRLNQSATAIYLVRGDNLVKRKGPLPQVLTLKDFNLKKAELGPKLNLLQYAGDDYLANLFLHKGRTYLILWSFDIGTLIPQTISPDSRTIFYLATREGRLVYSNKFKISDANFVSRPLVQRFAGAPINQGQLEFTGPDMELFYGFFYEIPRTNIIMFSETPRSYIVGKITKIALRLILIGVFGIFIIVGALQYPLNKVVGPIKDLARVADVIGEGNFEVSLNMKPIGELGRLVDAFSKMVENLRDRDIKINRLMGEQIEKMRLEGELNIARSIQENFLPNTSISGAKFPLEVNAKYVAAEEASGDWYNYYHDPDSGETVVAIADVSGHGAGSAMFTAIIAGFFDQAKDQRMGNFSLEEFANSVNGSMKRIGRENWMASMMALRHVKGEEEIEIIGAGHPFPVIMRPNDPDSKKAVTSLPMRSSVLGVESDIKLFKRRIPFPKDSTIVMYTDGLIEATNAKNKQYGRKRLTKICKSALGKGGASVLATIHSDWIKYRGNVPAGDDLCVITVKAAS